MSGFDELLVDLECPKCGLNLHDYPVQFKFGAPELRQVHIGDKADWGDEAILWRLPSRQLLVYGLPGYRRVVLEGYGPPCSNCGYTGECEIAQDGWWHFEIYVENDVLVAFRQCTGAFDEAFRHEPFLVLEP